MSPVPADIERISDLRFTAQHEPALQLDLYRQRDRRFTTRRPVIIWLHGGGWMSGDKERGVERIFGLVRTGFIGASVDYRLSQEALFPAQLHDCKCAVRFLRAQASDFHLDGDRIGVWGASSGGHLASLLAVTSGIAELEGERGWETASSAVQAACSWYGPTDLNLMDQFPPGVTPRLPSMTAESAEGRLVGGAIADHQALVAMANPIRYIHPDVPPILLVHGARDDCVPLVSSERFHAALLAQNVPAELQVVPDGEHNALGFGEHHRLLTQEFFERHLRAA